MTEERHDKEFLTRVTKALDESADRLDLRRQARLLQIRRQAVASVTKEKRRWPVLPRWVRIGAFATAVTAAAVALVWLPSPSRHLQQSRMEDMEIVASGYQLDFLEELEFYQWLESGTHG